MEKKNVFVMLIVIFTITLGIMLYCIFFGNQYMVAFDSNGGSSVENQFVRVGERAEEPKDPIREGYQFVEWQLNGEKYDFSSKVRKKIILIAHWRKMMDATELIYKIVFDSDGGSKVESQEVEAGGTARKPIDPKKDGYTFEGWFNGDAPFDFSKNILQDTTLKAKWKKIKSDKDDTDKNNSNKNDKEEKPSENKTDKEENSGKDSEEKPNKNSNVTKELKVGDRVKIVGKYAESSTSKRARHRRAIGWQRIVLKIYEGREYPYQVGNSTGTTGFFKAESLEKID